jgi:alkanesulfonate monooxygenase SsuD/methylene tetrahydromethanopterin reductase-like flavin-dependent oxidoreductase (luciferase family)
MSKPAKQVHLAAHFPGVNSTTVWSDPRAGSHIEFGSFAHLARTAERAKLDFLFLAEGLRLREQHGKIYDLDVVGRPDTFTVLAALAAVTDRLGLAGSINSTVNEPYEVARQFATLDHLSGGRAAWNVVTSWDAFTGENFRRGGSAELARRCLSVSADVVVADDEITARESRPATGCGCTASAAARVPSRSPRQRRHAPTTGARRSGRWWPTASTPNSLAHRAR